MCIRDSGYLTPYMVTDTDKMEAVLDNAAILITDKKISVIQEDVYKRQSCRAASPVTTMPCLTRSASFSGRRLT